VISPAFLIQSKQRMLSDDSMSLYFLKNLIGHFFTYNDSDQKKMKSFQPCLNEILHGFIHFPRPLYPDRPESLRTRKHQPSYSFNFKIRFKTYVSLMDLDHNCRFSWNISGHCCSGWSTKVKFFRPAQRIPRKNYLTI
jgi:hypothetical protein